jgi:hypothetical protein
MQPLTAESFWISLRDELRVSGHWSCYRANKVWTAVIVSAAARVCDRHSILTSREYFRLDLAGYTSRSTVHYDWDLRLAFEAENQDLWEDELCKLSHLIADLHVIVAYQLRKKRRCKQMLDEMLERQRTRLARHQTTEWAFIFGPRDLDDCWEAWAYSGDSIVPLHHRYPLLASEMPSCP